MRQPVSIIVPAYNAESTLAECLNALRVAMLPADELILFDDGSTDSTRSIAEAAGARIVRNPGSPKGPAHGRNTAAASATRPYLMFDRQLPFVERADIFPRSRAKYHSGRGKPSIERKARTVHQSRLPSTSST